MTRLGTAGPIFQKNRVRRIISSRSDRLLFQQSANATGLIDLYYSIPNGLRKEKERSHRHKKRSTFRILFLLFLLPGPSASDCSTSSWHSNPGGTDAKSSPICTSRAHQRPAQVMIGVRPVHQTPAGNRGIITCLLTESPSPYICTYIRTRTEKKRRIREEGNSLIGSHQNRTDYNPHATYCFDDERLVNQSNNKQSPYFEPICLPLFQHTLLTYHPAVTSC